MAINDAVKGKANSLPGVQISASVEIIIELLDKLDAMIDEIPPIQQPQRFGNQAFRTWYNKLKEVHLIFVWFCQVLLTYDQYRFKQQIFKSYDFSPFAEFLRFIATMPTRSSTQSNSRNKHLLRRRLWE